MDEDLHITRLASGDRPSIYVAGMCLATALKNSTVAVFMVDVLGRVHLLPADFVEIKKRPKLTDADLHVRPEDEAISLLVLQGEPNSEIVAYLKRRDSQKANT